MTEQQTIAVRSLHAMRTWWQFRWDDHTRKSYGLDWSGFASKSSIAASSHDAYCNVLNAFGTSEGVTKGNLKRGHKVPSGSIQYHHGTISARDGSKTRYLVTKHPRGYFAAAREVFWEGKWETLDHSAHKTFAEAKAEIIRKHAFDLKVK